MEQAVLLILTGPSLVEVETISLRLGDEVKPHGANRGIHFDRCTHRSVSLSLTWDYRPAYILEVVAARV